MIHTNITTLMYHCNCLYMSTHNRPKKSRLVLVQRFRKSWCYDAIVFFAGWFIMFIKYWHEVNKITYNHLKVLTLDCCDRITIAIGFNSSTIKILGFHQQHIVFARPSTPKNWHTQEREPKYLFWASCNNASYPFIYMISWYIIIHTFIHIPHLFC